MQTLTFKKREDAAAGTATFFFEKPENFVFLAGQYVAIKLDNLVAPDTRSGARSLSISSAPFEEDLAFTVRGGDSGFKQTLWKLEPGDTVSITPPVGRFVLEPGDTRPVVFLVGGVGITPARSILKQAEHEGDTRPFVLLYANRTLPDAPFAEELRSLKLGNFRYADVLSQESSPSQGEFDERGYITTEVLKRHVDKIADSLYYIVGSPSFIEAMEKMLDSVGVTKEQRHKDPFTGLGSANLKA
ncbi:MAG: hypothetical protein A2808_02155 [Candidatus Moranbacteria bacterium RIFCSPHIGHO2_01_FULL_55_24]|nr:MAG: hypothetical protein A2808_02155 [Candidatus Moranbacteria bacterium RIFCSPHIGHO2_01_FULL_55_24]